MKVLFVVSAGEDSGITTSAKTLASKLEKKGIKVEIDNFTETGFDLVHFHSPLPTSFFMAKLVFRNTPCVCTTNMTKSELDGLIPKPLVKITPKYLDFYYSKCDKILCSNMELKEKLDNAGYSSKTVFLPLPVDNKTFKKNKKAGERYRKIHGLKKKIVLSVASVQKRKGILDFVKLAEQLPEYDFVWAGKIPPFKTLEGRQKLKKIIRQQKHVLFPGHHSEKELVAAYSAADLFVSPSYSETFGLTIVEAAFCGLPILIRNLKALDNFKDFALYFNDNKDLKDKIVSVLEDKKLSKKLSKNSLEKSKLFSSENHTKKLIKIYEKLLERK